MSDEIKNLIKNTSNREGLARLLDLAAERLAEMRRELFPKRAQSAGEQKEVDTNG